MSRMMVANGSDWVDGADEKDGGGDIELTLYI